MISPPTEVAIAASTMNRVVIEAVEPEIDAGRFPIKRILGDRVQVEADIFADGHEVLAAILLYRLTSESAWREAPFRFLDNDRWRGEFHVTRLEPYLYTIQAWVDAFQTWVRDFLKKYDAGQDVSVDLLIGADLIRAAAGRAVVNDARKLDDFASEFRLLAVSKNRSVAGVVRSAELAELMARYPDRSGATTHSRELRVLVDREKARFSSWYEMFPRSCTTDPSQARHFSRLHWPAGLHCRNGL